MKPRIFHNPRCSKSRATLELLHAHGMQPEIIEYLQAPPSIGELKALAQKLGIDARDLVRTGEPEFKEVDLDLGAASEDEVFALLHAHPRLIQRPIVETTDAARIGRPPEQVLELFE
jgi:arsenate reductase